MRPSKKLTVSLTGLLLAYVAIPIVVAIVWVDKALLNGSILNSMPFKPELWAFWTFLFGLPHVFASLHTFAEREYIEFYRWKLPALAAFFIALPLVVIHYFGNMPMFLIFMGFIVYHTIVQQFGISLAALKQKPDVFYGLWKWSAILVGGVLYSMIYTSPVPLALDMLNPYREWLLILGALSLGLCLFSGLVLMWNASNRIGAAHVFVNTALVALDFALFQLGYFVFIVIIGRVVHEFTAWHIYAVHDANRANQDKPNLILKAFKFTGLPAYWLSILVAFVIGIAVTFGSNLVSIGTNFLISISLIHYYSESFIWKNGTIHRKNLSFSH